jgi:hypothetical protein
LFLRRPFLRPTDRSYLGFREHRCSKHHYDSILHVFHQSSSRYAGNAKCGQLWPARLFDLYVYLKTGGCLLKGGLGMPSGSSFRNQRSRVLGLSPSDLFAMLRIKKHGWAVCEIHVGEWGFWQWRRHVFSNV